MIECPRCHNKEETTFTYLEDVITYREITGIKNGRLQIKSLYETQDHQTPNERFYCTKCQAQFRVTDTQLESIDWGD